MGNKQALRRKEIGSITRDATGKEIVEGKKLAQKLIKKYRYLTPREPTFLEKLKDKF